MSTIPSHGWFITDIPTLRGSLVLHCICWGRCLLILARHSPAWWEQFRAAWWLSPPLSKIWVHGDDDIPNIWENKTWTPRHQPDRFIRTFIEKQIVQWSFLANEKKAEIIYKFTVDRFFEYFQRTIVRISTFSRTKQSTKRSTDGVVNLRQGRLQRLRRKRSRKNEQTSNVWNGEYGTSFGDIH